MGLMKRHPLSLKSKDEIDCKGRFFRGHINNFLNSKGHIVSTIKLIPLKRKSCSGCEHCGWVDEVLNEEIQESYGNILLKDIKDQGLYELVGKGDQYMTDCGMEYECYLEFEERKERENA